MSATLRIEDFTENTRLFKFTPPVIKIESRQFSVSIHFSRRTEENYVKEAFRKVNLSSSNIPLSFPLSQVSKIHAQLPEGGILVFLTGQQEVNLLVRRLRNAFPFTATQNTEDEPEEETKKKKKKLKRTPEINLPSIDLDK